MDGQRTNRSYLDYGIWRPDNPLSYDREFDYVVQYELTNVYRAIAALASWVGYKPEEPEPFDVEVEKARMAELKSEIEGLKSGKA